MPNKKVGIGLETKVDTTAAQKATAALSKQFRTLANQGVSVGKAFGGIGAALSRVNPIALGAVVGFKLLVGGIKGIISIGATVIRTIISIGRALIEVDKNIRVFNASLRQVEISGGATGASFETLAAVFNNISLQTGKYRNDLVDLAIKLKGIGAGQAETVSALIAASNASDALGKSFREVGEAIFTAENVSTRSLSKLGVNVSNLTQEFLSQEGAIKLITEQFGDQIVQLKSISILAERIKNAFNLAKETILEVVLGSTTVTGTFESAFAAIIGFVKNLRESPEIAKALSAVFDNIVKLLLSVVKLLPEILNLALAALQSFLETSGLLGTTFRGIRRALLDARKVLFTTMRAQQQSVLSSITRLSNEEAVVKAAQRLLILRQGTNKAEKEALANVREQLAQYQKGEELRQNFEKARSAIADASRTLTSGSGGTNLQQALDFLKAELANLRKGLNDDSKTTLKETLGSLESLKRSNELRAIDVKEEITKNNDAFQNFRRDVLRIRQGGVNVARGDRARGRGTPPGNVDAEGNLSRDFVRSITKGLGQVGKDIIKGLTTSIDSITTEANGKLVEVLNNSRDSNIGFYQRREVLLKQSLKLDEENVERQLAATSQAERDQIQHETNLAQKQIQVELKANEDFIKSNAKILKENQDTIITWAKMRIAQAKDLAKAEADLEKDKAEKRKERNKELLKVLFTMGDALGSIAGDESINKEIQKLREEYGKTANDGLEESMKAAKDFNRESAKNAENLAKQIDKLEQERHRELIRIDEDRNTALQSAIQGLSGKGTADDLAKARRELDNITIASEKNRNRTLDRFAMQINELQSNAADQFKTEQEEFNRQEELRKQRRAEEFEEAKKNAQEVQDKALETAREAGKEFGADAAKGILNAFFPGAGDLFAALNKAADSTAELATEFGKGIADFVAKAIENIISKLPEIILSIVAGFIENIPEIARGISRAVLNVLPSLAKGGLRVGAGIGGFLGAVSNTLFGTDFAESAEEILDDDGTLAERFDAFGNVINPTGGRDIDQIKEGVSEGLKDFSKTTVNPFQRPDEFALFNRQGVAPNFSGASGQRALVAALNKQIEELRRNSEALKENTEGFADDEFGQPPELRPGFRRAREAFNPYLDPSSQPDANSVPIRLQIQIGDQRLRDILVNLQESGYTQLVRAN